MSKRAKRWILVGVILWMLLVTLFAWQQTNINRLQLEFNRSMIPWGIIKAGR